MKIICNVNFHSMNKLNWESITKETLNGMILR